MAMTPDAAQPRRPVRSSSGLADQLVVRGMRPDPEPDDAVRRFHAQRAIVDANAHRVETPNLLEVKGGVPGIAFELFETAVGKTLDCNRQRAIALPELWRGLVIQSFVVWPVAWAFSAGSARASSFPARTSASN